MIPLIVSLSFVVGANGSAVNRRPAPSTEKYRADEQKLLDVVIDANVAMLKSCKKDVAALTAVVDNYKKRDAEKHATTIADLERRVKALNKQIDDLEQSVPDE